MGVAKRKACALLECNIETQEAWIVSRRTQIDQQENGKCMEEAKYISLDRQWKWIRFVCPSASKNRWVNFRTISLNNSLQTQLSTVKFYISRDLASRLIKRRLNSRNSSSLQSRNVNNKIHKTIICLSFCYRYKNCSFTLRGEIKSRVFQNIVLRRTYGSETEEVTKRRLEKLYDESSFSSSHPTRQCFSGYGPRRSAGGFGRKVI
jgi:hypothetical protein